MGPYGIAITGDGKYAYIKMALPISVFKVRLEDLAVEAVIDLSAYFPSESGNIALDLSENRLFFTVDAWRKLLVIDTQTMNVTHTIENMSIAGMIMSQYGPFLITWDGGNTARLVNTETYEITEFMDDSIGFLKIQESKSDERQWYIITSRSEGFIVGIYDYVAKMWNHSFPISLNGAGEFVFDFIVLPNEQKAYLATFGGWYPEYHAYGWLHSVDLVSGNIKVVPIDGGAFCLEVSPDGQKLFVGTAWPIPDTNNLLVLDTQSDEIIDMIYLGQTQYGWHYTQMNDLQLDHSHPGLLYATNGDGNALVKMDLVNLAVVDVHVFNQERFRPHYFVRQPGRETGYILIHQSPYACKFDLDQATIKGVVGFPNISQDAYAYDIAIDSPGKLLIAQGGYFLEVDAQDLHFIGTFPLPKDLSVWHFVLSNDQSMIYSISWGPEGLSDTFLAINTSNYQAEASIRLGGGSFNFRPYELPDGSKLYVLGGQQNGPVVIHVIETETYTIQKTITFEEPGMLGISAGLYYPFTYDSTTHMLFLGSTQVVLGIDTNTDVVSRVISLGDVARVIGLEPQQLIYFNAIGLVYNPRENYLYIAHLDYSFVSIYDLEKGRFLPQVITLKGFFPNFVFANDDYSKIFTLNIRSDSVSVIDVASKTEEYVIDLHIYLSEQ